MVKNKAAEKWLKRKKRKAQYWQVKRFMETLRLKYREKDKGMSTYCVFVPLFGMKFRFNGVTEIDDQGWQVFHIDVNKMEVVPEYFREDVLWYLIEKGYMSYIRDIEAGNNGRIFRSFIIDQGWGTKIIEKRIELCGKSPENTFLRMRMEEFLHFPLQKVLSHYPGFFDYLI